MHPLYQILKDPKPKRGSFATVWAARDHVLERQIALKEFWNWVARPVRGRLGFHFAHVRRLSLSHPGLASVYGADCDRGWLVLDHYPEGSLAEVSDPLPAASVRQILVEVMQSLSYLHEHGFIHAAVKPANLFLVPSGQVLLSDGLGFRVDSTEHVRDQRELFANLDPAEAKYVAPECLDGRTEGMGISSDLYSLGLTALELLLGGEMYQALFPRVQVRAQRWEEWHRSEEPLPSLASVLGDVPAELVEVVDGLVKKVPQERLTINRALQLLCPQPSAAKRVFRWADKTTLVGPPVQPSITAAKVQTDVQLAPSRSQRPRRFLASSGWLLAFGLGGWLGWQTWQPLSHQETRPTAPAPQTVEKVAPVKQEVKVVQGEQPRSQNASTQLLAELRGAQAERSRLEAEATRLAAALKQTQTQLAQAQEEVTESRKASDRLAGELLAARVDAKNVQADLEKHRDRADHLAEQLKRAEQELSRVRTEVEQFKSAAGRMGAQMKSLQGELVGARQEIEKHKTQAKRLTDELKQTQENLTRARADVEDHKMRLARLQMTKGPWDQLRPVHDLSNRSNDAAIAAFKALGAKVEVDERKPEQPVIKLDLTGCKVTNDNLSGLEGLTSLQTLYLSSTKITDAGLVYLKGLTNLRTLHLYDTQVSDSGLVHLGGLTQLETLYLSSTKVGDVGLAHLKDLTKLQSLNLTFTEVSDAGLLHLKGLTRLQTLHLSTTKVGDIGLAHLKELVQLRSLHLSYTQVSDTGLVHLKNLANLEELYLASPKITSKGLAELQQALPRCKIQQ